MKRYQDFDIKNLSHIKIGGVVKEYIEFESVDELKYLKECGKKFVIGKGSNILFEDAYFDETFFSLKRLSHIEYLGQGRVKIGAGSSLADLLKFMAQHELTGLEVLAGVPATVGGMLYMNAGANKISIFDFVENVTILDEQYNLVTLPKYKISHGYRETEFKHRNVTIVEAIFRFLEVGYSFATAMGASDLKKMKQPLQYPNLGSIFKNPESMGAWKAITECGLRGKIVGGAQISELHSNFIINIGSAKFSDVIELISEIKFKVKEKFAIELEEEIIIKKA
ncbi:MAG: UDP-N-acetylmuramate dehydrogenase [Fusobacteria bacterium]|nr:UDP-N-acetylmuramate dehydrogenase [Fusobacteriota bacterium]